MVVREFVNYVPEDVLSSQSSFLVSVPTLGSCSIFPCRTAPIAASNQACPASTTPPPQIQVSGHQIPKLKPNITNSHCRNKLRPFCASHSFCRSITHNTIMRFSSGLLFLVASAPLAIAYPEFTVPAAGASVPGGTAFTVTWKDSGSAPSNVDLTTYTLFLFSGSNATPQQLYQLAASTIAAGSTVSVTVPVGTGGATTNA